MTTARPPIRFTTAADGTRIAFAVSGSGPALVKIGTWMSHLDQRAGAGVGLARQRGAAAAHDVRHRRHRRPAERELLELIAAGRDNAQIAAVLSLSDKTVRNHITSIFAKLDVENRPQAIVLACSAGLGG